MTGFFETVTRKNVAGATFPDCPITVHPAQGQFQLSFPPESLDPAQKEARKPQPPRFFSSGCNPFLVTGGPGLRPTNQRHLIHYPFGSAELLGHPKDVADIHRDGAVAVRVVIEIVP